MSYSSENSYEAILSRCLNSESLANVDKRVGSIIYDALAPVCMELAEAYVQMDILEAGTFLTSATGSNLEKRVWDYGLTRKAATYAKRIAVFEKYKTDSNGRYVTDANGDKVKIEMKIDTGLRFAVPDNATQTFVYIGEVETSKSTYQIVQCEQSGSIGNSYEGTILPLSPIANLVSARIIGTYEPAEDTETDADLKTRALLKLNTVTFGGNIPDYIEKVCAIDGVGNAKVFPAWIGGGTVLISVVDSEFNPASTVFLQKIQDTIDPEYDELNNTTYGKGVGLAPIGHIVTVATPAKKYIKIKIPVLARKSLTAIQESVENVVKEYIDEVRAQFAQGVTLVVYMADIFARVKALADIVNVGDIEMDDGNGYLHEDIYLKDTDELAAADVDSKTLTIGKHFLPYFSEVELESL